jgi:integrating conjugative element protein (TIGR03752 family)
MRTSRSSLDPLITRIPMAIARNKLYPLLALLACGLVGGIIWRQVSTPAPTPPVPATPAGGPKAAPQRQGAPGAARPADGDSAAETLATVVASNGELRRQVQAAMEQNERVRAERDELRGSQDAIAARAREQVLAQLRAEGVLSGDAVPAPAAGPTPTAVGSAGAAAGGTLASRGASAVDRAGQAIGQAMDSAGTLLDGLKQGNSTAPRAGAAGGTTASPATRPAGRKPGPAANGIPPGLGYDDMAPPADGQADVDTSTYRVIAPVGYAEAKDKRGGNPAETHLVRAALGTGAAPADRPADRASSRAAEAGPGVMAPGSSAQAAGPDTPWFTIPENATLTRVTAMTAIVGRVPVDGRVTDPMNFKAIIGRENLAANGWDVPDEISGIVVSGIAIGDMALSCSEGRIHSLTFVFEDGSIRTVSSRRRSGAGGAAAGSGQASAGSQPSLGYISDLWGNPCISGRFVTNAPAYLTDVVGLRSLGVASRAYAAAQTTTTDSAQTSTTNSAVTGSRGAYVLGQAASGATDEVTTWILGRLKNSFDAVVTPAGQKIVLHVEQEIAIDRPAKPRRLDHQQAARASVQQGDHHGLD